MLLDIDAALGGHENDHLARLCVEHQADIALLATHGLLQAALVDAVPPDPRACQTPERLTQPGPGLHPDDPAGLAAASHRYLRLDEARVTDRRRIRGTGNKHTLRHRHSELAKQHLGIMLQQHHGG